MLDAYVVLRDENQRNSAVYTSEEGKVRTDWRDRLIMGIVKLNPEAVGSGVDTIADIEDKGRVSSLVLADVGTVDIEVKHLVGTSKTDEYQLPCDILVNMHGILIPTDSTEVPWLVIGGILRIPRMREINRLHMYVSVLMERPAVIDAPLVTRSTGGGDAQKGQKGRQQFFSYHNLVAYALTSSHL